MASPDTAADRLYGLPLDEFTPARNALAKETAKAGDREGADAIRSLRKPSVAAWALNQLARRHRDEVRALVRAGEQLRRAQEDLLAGGDREAFREASSREQQLVSELASLAVKIARDAGAAAPDALGHRLADTLRAAALDPAVAESLLAGRLVREQTASGLVAAAGPPGAPKRKAKAGAAKADTKAAAQAQERLRTAERELRDAEKAEAGARKQWEAAGRQTARLRERAEEALERLRQAEADERSARRALETAGDERTRLARAAEKLRRSA